jgi:hypothetical protein
MSLTHPHFIPNDAAGDRRRTAVLLVGTADEKGIDQRDIATTHTGFYISDAVADALDGTAYEVKRDTNPYATIDGPLADRRLDINSDAVGATGTPSGDGSPTVVKTVDGPLADTRLDLHSDATTSRSVERNLDVIPEPEEDEDDLDPDGLLDDEDEDSEEDDDSDTEDDEDAEGETYDPAEKVAGSMDDAKAWVTENPGTVDDIRAAEVEGKNRPKMLAWLDEFKANQTEDTETL